MTISLLLLLMPPALLALIIMAVATYFGVRTRGDRKAISAGVATSLPYVLILNHTIVLAVLLATLRAQGIRIRSIGKDLLPGQNLLIEMLLGLLAGFVLYVIGRFVIDPLSDLLQTRFGGYKLNKGQRLPQHMLAWLVAAVLFAPVVEESIYRGYGVLALMPALGTTCAIIVSSAMFGLLHWAYGWWGMAGAAIHGVLFALLFLWRQSLFAPVIAHALYNFISIFVEQKNVRSKGLPP